MLVPKVGCFLRKTPKWVNGFGTGQWERARRISKRMIEKNLDFLEQIVSKNIDF